jgi:membrane protein implicated in regulation of membrane protease activity
MDSMSEWLSPALVWFIIGFILIVLEFIIPGLITLFFGIGAWIVCLCCLFFDVPINVQLFIFIICSILSLIYLRKRFKSLFEKKADKVSLAIDELEEFIGQRAIVTKKITPNKNGRIEFRGSHWNAESDETIMKGKSVEIIAKKNITLIVKSL